MSSRGVGRAARALVALAGVGAVAIALPVWAQSGQGATQADPPPFETVDEMVDEYRVALGDPTLEFPSGVELPDSPVVPPAGAAARGGEGEAQFEDGFGEVEAADVWRCSWQVRLLDAVNSSNMSEAADVGSRLEGYYDLPAVERHVVDPGRYWYKDVVVPALDGDTAPLVEDMQYNCNPDFS